jgi:hypothetical protein
MISTGYAGFLKSNRGVNETHANMAKNSISIRCQKRKVCDIRSCIRMRAGKSEDPLTYLIIS